MRKLIAHIIYQDKSYKNITLNTNKENFEVAGLILSKLTKSPGLDSVVKSKLSGYGYQGYVILNNESEIIGEFYIFKD